MSALAHPLPPLAPGSSSQVQKTLTIAVDSPVRARLLTASSLSARSLHPFTVSTLEHPDDDQDNPDSSHVSLCITTSIVEPGGLNSLLESPPAQWTPTTPLIILYGVAAALEVLHASDCPHGAVSLGNILIDTNFEPRLSGACAWATYQDAFVAYLSYARMKRARLDRLFAIPPDPRSSAPTKAGDVFQLGTVFYLLLARGCPVDAAALPKAAGPARKFADDVVQRRPPLDAFPAAAQALIGRCWDRDPARRPAAAEIVAAIESAPAELGFPDVDVGAVKKYVRLLKGAAEISRAEYLGKLADAGSAAAAYFLGEGREAAGDAEKALEWFRIAADRGSVPANARVGMILHERQPAEAAKHYERAVAGGCADAMNGLGAIIEMSDPARAAELYRRAAERGSAEGRANSARCLERGIGVPRNLAIQRPEVSAVGVGLRLCAAGSYEEAAEQFRIAEGEGEVAGTFNLAVLAQKGKIEGGVQRAIEFYRRAIEEGFPPAMNNLGVLLMGTAEGKEEGLELIRRAANEYEPYAMMNLAVAIETAQCKGDIKTVSALYRRAAERGVPQAIVNYVDVAGGGLAVVQSKKSAKSSGRR